MNQPVERGVVEFKPRARLLRLIGAELISDEVVAITELVKNAHDADASAVTIEFHGVTTGNGEIAVRDDGHGMNLDVLLRHWMEPAGTSKGSRGARVTRRGRRVLGEKGVGRFAADKLARHLQLVSRRSGEPQEIYAFFDWDEFDSDSVMLSEVKNRWETRPATEISRRGTILRMSNLRAVWNERMFRRLCTRLTRLRSPFSDLDTFSICIESDEFPQYSGELRSDILDRAPYRIEASFDGDQTVEINCNGSRSMEHLWNGMGDLRCGRVRVRLFAFDLETDAIARIGPRMEVRAWLREWTGISIYRDGFRVWPYGEPHDDWLRLDQRRVNNPVVRLSNNQVVGFVEITRDGNPALADQTNREGILQSRAFEDLRRLLYFVLQILESERQVIRHPASPIKRIEQKAEEAHDIALVSELDRIAQSASRPISDQLRRLNARMREAAAAEHSRQRLLIEGYSQLAAVGQAAIGVSHLVASSLEDVRQDLKRLRSSVRRRSSKFTDALRAIESTFAIIDKRISTLSALEAGGRYRRRAMELPTELEVFRHAVGPLLEPQGVHLTIEAPRRGVLRSEMRPESFHRILHILTMNSLEWLRRTKYPAISIAASVVDEGCQVLFCDNGPGIVPELAEKVFAPMFSGREHGGGMGLTIARNIVELHGGEIKVLTDRRRRGATIRLVLPRKRSRATLHR
jgi:signal transduction histidine kinase